MRYLIVSIPDLCTLTYFEWLSMCQSNGNHVLKGATIKGKNLLPMGSIFFPLKVAPMRIEN